MTAALPTKEPTKKKSSRAETKVSATLKHQAPTDGKYLFAVGRRKSATATAKVYEEAGPVTVNGKSLSSYFQKDFEELILLPLTVLGLGSSFRAETKVSGGGIRGQAEAVRLAISRALIVHDPSWKKSLRSNGLMTRDPRAKERKKYGLKRARRAPQWTKR